MQVLGGVLFLVGSVLVGSLIASALLSFPGWLPSRRGLAREDRGLQGASGYIWIVEQWRWALPLGATLATFGYVLAW